MCSVYLSDAGLVDVPLAEDVVRNGSVPGSVGTTHVCLLLTILYSAVVSTVPRRSSASPFVGMLMAHC